MPLPHGSEISLCFSGADLYPKCFLTVRKTFEPDQMIDLYFGLSTPDLQERIRLKEKQVFVLAISNAQELSDQVKVLIALQHELRARRAVVLVFLTDGMDQARDLLLKAGCAEILRYDLTSKAFIHKLRRYILSLAQTPEYLDQEIRAESRGYRIALAPPLKSCPDFWLFRDTKYIRKVHNQWILEMIGPSPAAGKWEKSDENKWRWVTRVGNGFFDTQPGSWVFAGRQPEYSWNANRWGFVSESPALTFLKKGEPPTYRFRVQDSSLIEVARNSEFAVNVFPYIKETFGEGYYLKKSEGTVPWMDTVDTKNLAPEDLRDPEAGDEWGSDWDSERREPTSKPDFNRPFPPQHEFPSGPVAMQNTHIKGVLKGHEVDLLEYDETQSSLSLALDSFIVNREEKVDLVVKSENLGIKKDLRVSGVISRLSQQKEFGQATAVMIVIQENQKELAQFYRAIERRQQEVIWFLNRAKGL